jgi:hypothetical protein
MTAARTESPQKAVVRRLVDEVMNERRLDVADELCTPAMARRWRAWVEPFQGSFPDMRMQIVRLVEEGAWGIEDSLDRLRQLGLDAG